MILVNYTIPSRCLRQFKVGLICLNEQQMKRQAFQEWADLGFDNQKINRVAKTLG